MEKISYRRQLTILDPDLFADMSVCVIGLGGVGGNLVLTLKKHGIRRVVGFDGKLVSNVNPPCQVYLPRQVGRPKTEALAELVAYMQLGECELRHEYVTPDTELGDVVFLCIDHQMELRKHIAHAIFNRSQKTKLLIETRVDSNFIVVHSVIPNDLNHKEMWDHFWFPDTEAENDGGCAEPVSFGATSQYAAITAFSQMVQWFGNGARNLTTVPDNQIRIRMRPFEVTTTQW